jgi:hypothetical protein
MCYSAVGSNADGNTGSSAALLLQDRGNLAWMKIGMLVLPTAMLL